MAIATISELLQELQRLSLLEPGQQAELLRSGAGRHAEPRALGRDLIERAWLTPYQVNQLLLGRGAELRLGSYIILERLGEASAGEVYKARHQHMRRLAALVVVRPELLARPEAVQRFYEEVRAVSQLSHPNLVAAYDAGPAAATHFLAMEHVEGTDLQALVAQSGPLPLEQACRYTCQAALALQHGYERRLLHHDLRPAHLLLAQSVSGSNSPPRGPGLIKVRNLGLTIIHARRQRGAPADDAPELADYLAPEAARPGAAVDVRAELYSLGCILHFLLAGRVPFPGGTLAEKVTRHQHETPPPLKAPGQDVPEAVAVLVRRLLAKDPAQRCQAPREVSDALMALGTFGTSGRPLVKAEETPPPPAAEARGRRVFARPRWRQLLVVAAMALAVALLLFGFLLVQPFFWTLKPGPPALVVQCGKGDGNDQDELVLPGYGYRVVQANNFSQWRHPLRTHCWAYHTELRFEVTAPPRTPGVLRLFCLDADSLSRKQRVFVQGKLIEQIDIFDRAGRLLEINLSAEDMHDGRIDVMIENLNPTINAVISTVEFAPLRRAP